MDKNVLRWKVNFERMLAICWFIAFALNLTVAIRDAGSDDWLICFYVGVIFLYQLKDWFHARDNERAAQ